jgi:hypothetical protein
VKIKHYPADGGEPMDIEMSTEEARMIWLTMLGSDWVDEDVIMDAPSGSPLDTASMILDCEALIDFDYYRNKIKLRCKL